MFIKINLNIHLLYFSYFNNFKSFRDIYQFNLNHIKIDYYFI